MGQPGENLGPMSGKADGDFVRRQNRSLVLEGLRCNGPQARSEIGRRTGLSPATISSITADLLDEGVLKAGEDAALAATEPRAGPGRPLTRLALNGTVATVLGIEISVDRVRFVLCGYDGHGIADVTLAIATRTASAANFGRQLARDAKSIIARSLGPGATVARIGVSVQGIADVKRGRIAWSPAFAARDIDVCGPLRLAFRAPVTIANDMNLVARTMRGRRPEALSAAVVFTGYGVGMGLILGGGVYDGPTGAAAELGHTNHVPDGPKCRCGCNGCVEAYAADYGILRAAENGDPAAEPTYEAIDAATMAAMADRARLGDRRVAAAYASAGLALGYGLARSIALLDLERITLMGSGVRAYDLLQPGLEEGLRRGLPAGLRKSIPIEIEPGERDPMTYGLMQAILGDVDALMARRGSLARSEAMGV